MKTQRRAAFTLVELLVVIGIIAILASILLPAVIRAIGRAEIMQAKTEVRAIETALKVYLNDYNQFPSTLSSGSGTTDDNTTKILRGITNSIPVGDNPRGVNYLDCSEKSIGTNVTLWGSSSQGTGNIFYDPWGRPYNIVVDYSGTGTISADGESLTGRSVAVWSWGPTAAASANSADVTHIRSWK